MTLQERAIKLSKEMFVGGPPKDFEFFGRAQLIALIRNGLNPDSKVLDIGCGCLRGGYWIIQFLNPGCYYGIEPNEKMLKAGIDRILEPYMVKEKYPHFDHNDAFYFSVFGQKFDFILARSIWTHASKPQIEMMLDSFIENSHAGSVFLTSFQEQGIHIRRNLLNPRNWFKLDSYYSADYQGAQWVGRSHESDIPGMVRHNFAWIKTQCNNRRLTIKKT